MVRPGNELFKVQACLVQLVSQSFTIKSGSAIFGYGSKFGCCILGLGQLFCFGLFGSGNWIWGCFCLADN